MKLVAHRGGRGFGTDNTVEAMEKAVAAGVRMIETDVRTTADGRLVICHDQSIWGFPVSRVDYDDLVRHAPERPLLSELLERLAGWVRFNLEIKDAPAGAVGEMLERYRIEADTLVTSFHARFLEEFRELYPGTEVGLLFRRPYGHDGRIGAALRVGATTLLPYFHSINTELVEDAHRGGFSVWAWTVNDLDDVERLSGWGVDGLITDRYLELREHLGGKAPGR